MLHVAVSSSNIQYLPLQLLHTGEEMPQTKLCGSLWTRKGMHRLKYLWWWCNLKCQIRKNNASISIHLNDQLTLSCRVLDVFWIISYLKGARHNDPLQKWPFHYRATWRQTKHPCWQGSQFSPQKGNSTELNANCTTVPSDAYHEYKLGTCMDFKVGQIKNMIEKFNFLQLPHYYCKCSLL